MKTFLLTQWILDELPGLKTPQRYGIILIFEIGKVF